MSRKKDREAQKKIIEEGGVSVKMVGMFRVNIVNDKAEVIGDSGWKKNVFTVFGENYALKQMTETDAPQYPIETAALGTGGTVAYSNTDLPGYITVTNSTLVQSTVGRTTNADSLDYSLMQFLIEFHTGWNAATATIDNVGLYDDDGPGVGGLWAGNNFDGSAVATNQQVNVTYNILLGGPSAVNPP